MESRPPTLEGLMAELQRMRAESSRMKAWGSLAWILIGVIFLLGQSQALPQTVQATKFMLVGEDGRVGAELSFDKFGPTLKMMNHSEGSLAQLTSGGLSLSREGEPNYRALLMEDGLRFRDKKMTVRANLWIDDKDDSTYLVFRDKTDKERAELVLLPDGTPYFAMYYKDGRVVLDRPVTAPR